ncbi:MAG: pilus (MSHA type) biogenesis protein MshL [Gammaproteobacteria bacterium]|nr:pilus (MSHA type) biogenesis protein MshL [Gammaproteobacteria bacterium]
MKRATLWWAAAVAAGVLSGCAQSGFDRPLSARMQARLAAAQKADAARLPSSVSAALVPAVTIQLPHRAAMRLPARFDFSAVNAPARQVFLGLMRGTPYSIALPPHLGGRITVRLKRVTVPEAMRIIRREAGYQYQRDGNQFFVLGSGLMTRLFRVHYLNIVRTAVSETRLSGNNLTSVGTTGIGGGMGAPGTNGGMSQSQAPTISVKTTSRSDFWKTLRQTVTALVGDKGGRRVIVNPTAGVLVVRADAATLHTVARFLRQTQASVDREVVIDAKILEVDLKSGYQSGIDWAQLGRVGDASVTAAQTGGGGLVTSGAASTAGQVGNINPQSYLPINGTLASAFGGIFSVAIHASNFAGFIQLLSSEGRVQVLSSPRVSTINGQKAVIKVGGDQFFVTGVTNSEQLLGAVSAVTTPSVELTPFFSGIALDVTPEIDRRGSIILYIHPSVSKVTQVNQQFSVSGQAFNLPLASSSVQESDSVVRARSGQVIVLGGLMEDDATNQNAHIPFFGDLPVIGNLFKDKRVVHEKKELVILLKPTVVNLAAPWGRELTQAQRQIRRMAGH